MPDDGNAAIASPAPAPDAARPHGRRRWIGLAALAMLLVAGAYLALAQSGRPRPAPPASGSRPAAAPVSVVTAPARTADVGVYLTGLGSVTPLNTVTVRTRVDGELMSVRYREGQLVAAGDLLAEIDPRPFQVQLAQAEGQLARDQALLENARLDLQRYEVLVTQDAIPKQQLDTQRSLVQQDEGAVKTDQAQVDNARLQLVYCRITSPISGRVGLRLVDPGNIVHAADTGGLVVITQLQPISVIFTLPEDNIPAVLDKLARGAKLPVEAFDREQRTKLASGTLLTIDNQVDPTTGTVKLRAEFPNTDNRLFANQFVNARLLLDTRRGASVIPSVAVQPSGRGPFVYVLNPDHHTVAVRTVALGPADGNSVAIDKGLSPGDVVVVDGAERLRDGAAVTVQSGSSS
jgi:membrane fusion protein, multidrug efflux system